MRAWIGMVVDLEGMEQLYERRHGFSRTELNRRSLKGFDKSTSLLEVGTNIGNQLLCLLEMGLRRFEGIDLQHAALLRLRSRGPPSVESWLRVTPSHSAAFLRLGVHVGSADSYPPAAVRRVMAEISRCAVAHMGT